MEEEKADYRNVTRPDYRLTKFSKLRIDRATVGPRSIRHVN
jgi:hypothetical protein